jgi:hypothetical protein
VSTTGALFVALAFGLWALSTTGSGLVFWIVFFLSCLFGMPLAFIMDMIHAGREAKKEDEDARAERLNKAVRYAGRRRGGTINIDARQVHYHKESNAQKGFVESHKEDHYGQS